MDPPYVKSSSTGMPSPATDSPSEDCTLTPDCTEDIGLTKELVGYLAMSLIQKCIEEGSPSLGGKVEYHPGTSTSLRLLIPIIIDNKR